MTTNGKTAEVGRYLRKLERLADYFLGKDVSTDGLWRFELDLLSLQKDVQLSITEAKRRLRTDKAVHSELEWLRNVRWQARRLGDAFAWTAFGTNRQLLFPLARNSSVAVSGGGDGERGMLNIAEHLNQQGWGFPIIHDITDCLRIGDITFIRAGQDPLTVEIKTRPLGERLQDGQRLIEYQISVTYTAMNAPNDLSFTTGVPSGAALPNTQAIDQRFVRQRKRMHTAKIHQTAATGKIINIDGAPSFFTSVEQAPGQSTLLRRLVRRAKQDGYSSETMDDAVFYFAYYAEDGVGPNQVTGDRMMGDLRASGVFLENSPEENSATLFDLLPPDSKSDSPRLFMPFYLYPIPRTAIRDILHGRLIIFAVLSGARIVSVMERAGFRAASPRNAHPMLLEFEADVRTRDGRDLTVRFGGLGQHILEAVYEFRGLEHVERVARVMLDSFPMAAEEAARALFTSQEP